jgi:hypothetical protein
MMNEQSVHEKRKQDPYLDRRMLDDRRDAFFINYFLEGGAERRANRERRIPVERREGCTPVSKWSSVCVPELASEALKRKKSDDVPN